MRAKERPRGVHLWKAASDVFSCVRSLCTIEIISPPSPLPVFVQRAFDAAVKLRGLRELSSGPVLSATTKSMGSVVCDPDAFDGDDLGKSFLPPLSLLTSAAFKRS